jgi:hypothetical protein
MELEFDKEINAILRKAGRQPSAAAAVSPHVDADTIAAFAENALPSRARPPLIEHFAACDNCRQVLSQTILLNAEAGATAASSVVNEAPVEITVPWWRKLFSTPGLALAMGALVVMFTGVLGYIALHNRSASNADVSQIGEPEQPRGGPYDSGAPSASMANAPANTMPMSNSAMSSNAAVMNSNAMSAASNSVLARKEGTADTKTAGAPADNGFVLDGVAGKPGEPAPAGVAAPAPPPPVTTTMATTEDEKKKEDSDKLAERGRDIDSSKDRENDDRRDAPAAAAKSGPARSGPYQMKSNQAGNGLYDMSVKRTVGGKTFNNRDGAWYDSAYHGQSTTDIRRGTNEFKKLDGGLRNVANNLGGVVVVVWKSKAYRIQ